MPDACPVHVILLDLISVIMLGKNCELQTCRNSASAFVIGVGIIRPERWVNIWTDSFDENSPSRKVMPTVSMCTVASKSLKLD
jgi:hypothetical protein